MMNTTKGAPARPDEPSSGHDAGGTDPASFFTRLLAGLEEVTAPFRVIERTACSSPLERAQASAAPALARRLHACASRIGVGSTSIVHLAWAQVLSKTSGRQDVVFGSVLSPAQEASRETGSTLPVRIEIGEQSVLDCVRHMDTQLSQLKQYVDTPLEEVRRCSSIPSAMPLYAAVLACRPGSSGLAEALPDEAVQRDVEHNPGCPFLLSVVLGERSILMAAETDATGVAARMCTYLLTALEQLVDALDQAPYMPVHRIGVLPQAEREQLLVHFNATAKLYPQDRTLQDLFEEQARRAPDAPALLYRQGALTYGQLDAQANQLAHHLQASGVRAGDRVALALERSPELVIAELAVLKAGAAYVPLSSVLPPERQTLILRDCEAALLVTASAIATPGFPVVNLRDPRIAECPTTNPGVVCEHGTIAYVMYTSGSTGRPKGVAVQHRAVVRLVVNNGYADFQENDRIAFASNPAFDASTMEVWGALLNGGAVVVIEQAELLDSVRFCTALQKHAVTVLWLTVGLFNQYAAAMAEVIGKLRYLIVGGDKLDPRVIAQVLRHNPPQHLLNGYGPTETTTFATTHEITHVADEANSIPIGRPIGNTQIYILDHHGEPCPIGVAGEIHIGGDGVAQGYLNQPELSVERFVPDPFAGGVNARMYKSGDLGYWRADGCIEYVGRNDFQVKIRGFRIETGEIESVLSRHAAVKECAVVALREPGAEARLIAYVVPADAKAGYTALREYLTAHLPDFMVPAAIVFLPALPLTVNGKLDRAALPAAHQRPDLAQPYREPVDTEECVICALMAVQLGIDRVGRDDNFFELGGNSLAATQLLVLIHEKTGASLSPAAIFNDPTAAGIVRALRTAGGKAVNERDTVRSREKALSDREPIAIIAMSGRFPGATDVETLWRKLRNGEEAVTYFDDDELDPSISYELRRNSAYVKARAVIDDADMFDAPFFGISPREAEVMDPQQRVFLESCWECLERGGYAPDAIAATVGVFAGMHTASYREHHIRRHPDVLERAGDMTVMLGNEKDYIATRVAHRLNLTGPAVSVHTACSTSLVAVAQAVTSLRAGQCDMALAGGVAISCPPRSGYLYQEGAILSPDGHTRTFDADASGTVFGDGCAVVLLKRLADAQNDGDPVLGVIRGVAINNDGRSRASFTAPGVDGQVAVIAAALEDADVDARDISYVEAHGTATPIGDPIEIEALTRAYRRHTDDNGYCWVGSIKSNLGHLITAAGATGLIKTLLALRHEELPPTLHYRAANPKIPFERTPFIVNDRLVPWPRTQMPRRAGVSAFGFGGTNAHVIVEEAPPGPVPQPGTGPQLLILSARSTDALKGNASRLAAWLAADPDINLADVAYTLRVGRKPMSERMCVVAKDPGQAAQILAADSHAFKAQGKTCDRTLSVVFMFPGQAAQYGAMGRELYRHLPAFRAAFDECTAALQDAVDFDIKERLFGGDASALVQTAVTQPALFCIEYALARHWMSLGVQPAALIGHSVGEFVAATLAGVFRLEDALRLVARRGALMQALPPGAMLAVRLDPSQLEARLPQGLSLAAENSPSMSVVAGPAELVDQFRAALEREGISARALQTSHAFHSAMMDAAVVPFEREVRLCKLSPPRLPLYSTVTGQLLQDAQACDPNYWARHLREPVRFSPALKTLTGAMPGFLLEVGPRATLTTLARQHGQSPANTVASLADHPDGEQTACLLAAGRLWLAGAAIDLEPLDGRSRKLRVTLPGYSFERRRYWLDAGTAADGACREPRPERTAPPPGRAVLSSPPQPQENSMPQHAATKTRIPELTARLREVLENTSGIDMADAPASASFIEIGLDSLTLTQVANQIKQAFKVKITFRQLMEEHRSLEQLAAYLDRQLPAAPQGSAAAPAAPAVAIAPAAPVAPFPAPVVHGNAVHQLIQQQMQLMAQQLMLLQGGAFAAPAAAVPAEPAAAQPEADEPPQGAMKYDVKKAFGAIARIHTDSGTALSARQRSRLEAFMRRYVERTRRSREHVQQHRAHLADPRVVNGFRPMLKEIVYQIVVARSKGARLWDLDGNEYVDANNGFGMSLFGWQPEFVVEAVRQQLDAGYEIGPLHPVAGEVAQLLCELTGHERAGLCNTGSEAVMGAMRIARTVTGRNLIVLFSGSYHGIFDEVIVRGTKRLRPVPAAPGIMPNTTENVIVLDYGTPESLDILRSRIDDLAAVLVEPVQSRRPDFQPVEFLREVRDITSKSGAVLIFDEVITGFRTAPGGIQALFGIRADLCTYGKVIGGGFPIGVIAGKREYMDALDGGWWQFGDDSAPTAGVTYFAGTFVRHPLALAAAKASLEHIKSAGAGLQEQLNGKTADLAATMNAFCREVGAPIEVRHFSSLWKIFFTEDHLLQDLLFAMMRNRGVHILDHFPCFLTTAHTVEDIARIKNAFMEAVIELQESDFIPRRATAVNALFDATRPPVPHARLGKDPQGNPAWYVPDENNLGKYVKIDA